MGDQRTGAVRKMGSAKKGNLPKDRLGKKRVAAAAMSGTNIPKIAASPVASPAVRSESCASSGRRVGMRAWGSRRDEQATAGRAWESRTQGPVRATSTQRNEIDTEKEGPT